MICESKILNLYEHIIINNIVFVRSKYRMKDKVQMLK